MEFYSYAFLLCNQINEEFSKVGQADFMIIKLAIKIYDLGTFLFDPYGVV